MEQFKAYYLSPLGYLEITGNAKAITSVQFVSKSRKSTKLPAVLKKCRKQLTAYFRNKKKNFSLNLALSGTAFEKAVWTALTSIPYGRTVSYGDIAKMIRNPRAVRAVGTACKKNKLAVIVPCHRVIPKNKGIGRYAGGVSRKKWLIEHEQK